MSSKSGELNSYALRFAIRCSWLRQLHTLGNSVSREVTRVTPVNLTFPFSIVVYYSISRSHTVDSTKRYWKSLAFVQTWQSPPLPPHWEQRGANLPILWRPSPLYCLSLSPFSNFVQPPFLLLPSLPCHLQPPHPLFFLLSCFFGRMGDHATFDVLFYLMIKWIYTSCTISIHISIHHVKRCYLSTRMTLMCVLCNNVSSLLRSDT